MERYLLLTVRVWQGPNILGPAINTLFVALEKHAPMLLLSRAAQVYVPVQVKVCVLLKSVPGFQLLLKMGA